MVESTEKFVGHMRCDETEEEVCWEDAMLVLVGDYRLASDMVRLLRGFIVHVLNTEFRLLTVSFPATCMELMVGSLSSSSSRIIHLG